MTQGRDQILDEELNGTKIKHVVSLDHYHGDHSKHVS